MMQAALGAFFGALAGLALYEQGRRRDECISNAIERSERRIMSKFTDLRDEFNSFGGVISQVSENIDTMLSLITNLQNQQGSGSEVSAEDLSALHEEVKAMRAKLVEVYDKSDDYNAPSDPTARHRG